MTSAEVSEAHIGGYQHIKYAYQKLFSDGNFGVPCPGCVGHVECRVLGSCADCRADCRVEGDRVGHSNPVAIVDTGKF
jgi:hypothetical protein